MDPQNRLLHQHCCLLPADISNTLCQPGAVKVECVISHDQAADEKFLAQLNSELSSMLVDDPQIVVDQGNAPGTFVAERASGQPRTPAPNSIRQIGQCEPMVGVDTASLSTATAAVQYGSTSIYSIYESVFAWDVISMMIVLFVSAWYGVTLIPIIADIPSCILAAYTRTRICISPPPVVSIPLTRRRDSTLFFPPAATTSPAPQPRQRTERHFILSPILTPHHRSRTTTPTPRTAAPLHDLAPAAQSASSLLSSFAVTALAETDTSRHSTQKKRLNMALLAVLSVRAGMRERYGAAGMHVKSGDLVVDAGCVVCCAEVVDTVLMPCRHMVVCRVGCPLLGGARVLMVCVDVL